MGGGVVFDVDFEGKCVGLVGGLWVGWGVWV